MAYSSNKKAFSVVLSFLLLFSTLFSILSPAKGDSSANANAPSKKAETRALSYNKGDIDENSLNPESLSKYSGLGREHEDKNSASDYSATENNEIQAPAFSLKNAQIAEGSGENASFEKENDNFSVLSDTEPLTDDFSQNGEKITAIAVNSAIRDNLSSPSSVNRYTFTLSERGSVICDFKHVDETEEECLWYMTLFEEYSPDGLDANEENRPLNRSAITVVGDEVRSPRIGLLPGNYSVTIECVSGYTGENFGLVVGFMAGDDCETECNDAIERYTYLPLDKTFIGSASNLPGAEDRDWYMFKTTDTGYCVLNFDHGAGTIPGNGVAFIIRLIDVSGNEYLRTSSPVGDDSYISGILGLPPGYYFISVSSQIYTDANYNISVSFTSDPNIERELNDAPETANPLNLNSEIIGSLAERDEYVDRDYYSFTLENDGFIVIDFLHETLSESHGGWNISIINKDGDKFYSAVSDWTQGVLQSPSIGLPKGDYYILIDSLDLYRSSIVYRLALLTAREGSWETEPNDAPENADDIVLGTPVNGALTENGVNFDADYYAFNAEAGSVEVAFEHIKSDEKDKEGWIITLLDENLNEIKKTVCKWDEGAFISADVPGGKYYILIETGLNFNSGRYILDVNLVKPVNS